MKIAGILIVTLSTIMYAIIGPLIKKTNSTLLPFTVMSFSMFSLFLLSFVFSLIFEKSWAINFSQQKSNINILLLVGFINMIAFWLGILGYKYMPLWQQSLFGLMTPVLVGIFAFFILGEPISYKLFIGLLIMGIGLFVTVK